MPEFSFIERKLSAFLDQFPILKRSIKYLYQRVVYLRYMTSDKRSQFHSSIDVFTPFNWIGFDDGDIELFFGYYDKPPWNWNCEKAVFHKMKNKGSVSIVLFDKATNSYSEIGASEAWSRQQGTMAQWITFDGRECVIYNTVVNRKIVARVIAVDSVYEHVVPWPIQCIHPDGKNALCINYCRLNRICPEYGYQVSVDNFDANQPLSTDGLWHIDLINGERTLLVALSNLLEIKPRKEMNGAKHIVNHAIYSPKGNRFVFIHRWFGSSGRYSRCFIANSDGAALNLLMDNRVVSHYAWLDENKLLVWGRGDKTENHYQIINIETGSSCVLDEETLGRYGDGHPSISPNGKFMVFDTYPDKARYRSLFLYNFDSKKVTEICRLFSPWKYDGDNRCDLHPRWDREGKMISIDSTHEGKLGTYFIDVTGLVGNA